MDRVSRPPRSVHTIHMKSLSQYLHTHRLRSALSEQELANLLGLKSASAISRFETGARSPTIAAALACQVLFDVTPAALFPKLYANVEEAVMRNAHVLYQKLQGNPSPGTRAKLDFLEAAQKRALDRAAKLNA
jgi:transcriptional regulator with XRE-family HTH domain